MTNVRKHNFKCNQCKSDIETEVNYYEKKAGDTEYVECTTCKGLVMIMFYNVLSCEVIQEVRKQEQEKKRQERPEIRKRIKQPDIMNMTKEEMLAIHPEEFKKLVEGRFTGFSKDIAYKQIHKAYLDGLFTEDLFHACWDRYVKYQQKPRLTEKERVANRVGQK